MIPRAGKKTRPRMKAKKIFSLAPGCLPNAPLVQGYGWLSVAVSDPSISTFASIEPRFYRRYRSAELRQSSVVVGESIFPIASGIGVQLIKVFIAHVARERPRFH